MHILLVVTGLPDKNSPARSVFNLTFAKELANQGHRVTILYLRAINPKYSFFEIKDLEGIKCLQIRSTIPKVSFIKHSSFQSSLFKLLLNNQKFINSLKNIDVIHAIGGGSVEASFLIAHRFKLPLVSQFIGSDLNTHFIKFLKKKNFINGVKKSKFLCFNSKGLEQVFLSEFKNVTNTHILYRGVKLENYSFNFDKTKIISLLFLGGFPSMGNLKGGITLLDAILLLNNEKLKSEINIKIGGPNSLAFENYLSNVENSKMKIDFIGAIDRDLVKDYMCDSHIVVIPSMAEGLPNVLYEAMASGNMVIASNVGGIPEILEHGITGELVPPNDPSALMKSILKSASLNTYIEECAINGRKNIEEMDYSKFIEGYTQVYKKAMHTKINFKSKLL